MTKVKRYEVEYYYMTEATDGDYVKFWDHEKLQDRYEKLAELCLKLLQSDEVQKAWPLDGARRAEKPSDTHSSATVTVKFRRLLAIHSALAAVKGGEA